MTGLRVGFALCGSFCTFETALGLVRSLIETGADVTPILSYHAASVDTRFGTAASFTERLETLCGHPIIATLPDAEPIGPKRMFDVLVVAPCTGNTLGKLAAGITDTPVTMAVKSHLRNERPVVLAVATNDALSGSARSIGELLGRRNLFFVPLWQDDPDGKPRSVVFRASDVIPTIREALAGRQIQPILAGADNR